MRALFCALVLSVVGCSSLAAKPAPLSIKDVSLMLRSGYSVAAVESELRRRYFLESVDAANEKALLLAGATPALITGLRSGTYAVPPQEIAAEEARLPKTLYQQNLAQERAVAAATAPLGTGTKIADLVKGDLVTSRNGILHAVSDGAFEKKKLIALYFAGQWCGQCRKFTPELVDYYNRIAAARPEFEIVFVSSDRSAAAMEKYMSEGNMPWPAVKFEKVAEKTKLNRYAGSGIPCLVLVDASGRVISDSYAGKNYVGPSKVLRDLDQLFAGRAAAAPVAQR